MRGKGRRGNVWGGGEAKYFFFGAEMPTKFFCTAKDWGAANGGLRDGGLRKSEDI